MAFYFRIITSVTVDLHCAGNAGLTLLGLAFTGTESLSRMTSWQYGRARMRSIGSVIDRTLATREAMPRKGSSS